MINIWKDQEIIKIINILKDKKRTKQFQSDSIPKLIFICGKQILDINGNMLSSKELQDNIRYYILKFLDKQHKIIDYGKTIKLVSCVLSEKLYEQDWAEDILSFEELLAEISEYIIIVAESPGTYCELGAFVLNDKFMKKTIVINEDKPEHVKSFITRGPIKKIKDNNPERVIYHSGLERIKHSTEFREKIQTLAEEKIVIKPNQIESELKVKSLIYEFANIVELFQPLEGYEIQKIYKEIYEIKSYDIKNKNKNKIRSFAQVIELMEKMEFLKKEKGMYYLKGENTFFNVISSIDRKEFNELRLSYLSRVYKLEPDRMEK